MKALVYERNVARYVAARAVSAWGSGRGAGIGPLRLLESDPPALPAPDWVRVSPTLSGICGSDLATIDGRSSRYFEDLVSFPFVPGHEVVGTLESGRRVVLQPVLGCAARAIEPPCPSCAEGRTGDCERVAFGHLAPGLQTGYCADTGGGWSEAGLVAHHAQLHPVPDDLSDADAVMVEPTSCAAHAVATSGLDEGDDVAVVGAGTLGLCVTASLDALAAAGAAPRAGSVVVGARYAHQRRWAEDLGASAAVPDGQLARAVRRKSRSLVIGGPQVGSRALSGGADLVFDCVGSADSIAASLAIVRPRGKVVLVGMPGRVHVDLAPLWHREVSLAGAYAYGTEHVGSWPAPVSTFDLAFAVVRAHRLGRLVSATYPIERYEEAIAHAGAAGRRGAVKVAFDLRREPRRGAALTAAGAGGATTAATTTTGGT